jgi:pimeloyl-ACP methyl ester carboxylesterase
LAGAGFAVAVPDVPGNARGEVTGTSVQATVAIGLAMKAQHRVLPGRVALFGISTGTTLALLAAEQPELASGVSIVAGITGYTDLVDLIRLATTGTHCQGAAVRPYPAEPFLALCVGRSVAAALQPGPDRDSLLGELEALPDDDPDPLACVRGRAAVGPAGDAGAAIEILANQDPGRYDELYARLPEGLRAQIEGLSPVHGAPGLRCRVELLFDPRDKYFPLEHALALARAAPSVRVTITRALAHADTRFSLRAAGEVVRLAGFVIRALQAARCG